MLNRTTLFLNYIEKNTLPIAYKSKKSVTLHSDNYLLFRERVQSL